MKFCDFYAELEALAPRELSAVWDNDGVMCKVQGTDEVSKVLVALDPTERAIEYAAERGFDVLLTHHPLIFKGLKALNGEDTVSSRVLTALSRGISVVSLHTRLDAAEGGVNDALLDRIRAVPAGVFGDAETPTLGRLGTFSDELDADELALRVKAGLGCDAVRVTGGGKVRTVAVVGGDGKDFIIPAMRAGADAFITGDAGYNAAEAAAEMGFIIMEAGHYHTEAPVCALLAERLKSIGLYAEVHDFSPYRIC